MTSAAKLTNAPNSAPKMFITLALGQITSFLHFAQLNTSVRFLSKNSSFFIY